MTEWRRNRHDESLRGGGGGRAGTEGRDEGRKREMVEGGTHRKRWRERERLKSNENINSSAHRRLFEVAEKEQET